MTIGVLALQGDFAEHINILEQLGVTAIEVRTVIDAESIDGLIIPGGESTSIGKLLQSTGLDAWITTAANNGMPVYGTCAGCILLAKDVNSPYSLQLIDIAVERNAYGRQRDSFEAELTSEYLPGLMGTFIRAPRISNILDNSVETLASDTSSSKQPEAVLVQQKNILAGTFHPELHNDLRVHEHFVEMVDDYCQS